MTRQTNEQRLEMTHTCAGLLLHRPRQLHDIDMDTCRVTASSERKDKKRQEKKRKERKGKKRTEQNRTEQEKRKEMASLSSCA